MYGNSTTQQPPLLHHQLPPAALSAECAVFQSPLKLELDEEFIETAAANNHHHHNNNSHHSHSHRIGPFVPISFPPESSSSSSKQQQQSPRFESSLGSAQQLFQPQSASVPAASPFPQYETAPALGLSSQLLAAAAAAAAAATQQSPELMRPSSSSSSLSPSSSLSSAALLAVRQPQSSASASATAVESASQFADCCTSSASSSSQKAVAFLAGPKERIHVLGHPVNVCPRCLAEDGAQVNWKPHRNVGELKIRYICDRFVGNLESNHHFDIPLCPLCNHVLYIFEYNSMLGVSNARRLHKYVLKCSGNHVLPLLDLFCQTKKGGDRCNANFKLQWCYGTMVKRCEAQKNRDHDLWWVRYKNEWKQRRTIIRYKKDFLSHLSDTQRMLLLGLGLEGEPPPDPKLTLGPTFDSLVASAAGGPPAAAPPNNNNHRLKKRAADDALAKQRLAKRHAHKDHEDEDEDEAASTANNATVEIKCDLEDLEPSVRSRSIINYLDDRHVVIVGTPAEKHGLVAATVVGRELSAAEAAALTGSSNNSNSSSLTTVTNSTTTAAAAAAAGLILGSPGNSNNSSSKFARHQPPGGEGDRSKQQQRVAAEDSSSSSADELVVSDLPNALAALEESLQRQLESQQVVLTQLEERYTQQIFHNFLA